MMNMKSLVRRRVLPLALALTSGASLPALIPSCGPIITTINPCGTVLAFCGPEDVDLLYADIPDFNLDPTCTIPYFGVNNPGLAAGCSTVPVYPNTPGPRPSGRN